MATLKAQFCSPEEQRLSAQPNAPLHCLTRNESIALAFLAQSGALSLFACVLTFALILRNIRYHARRMPGQWQLIKGPMDVYLLSVFAGEAILSIGGFLNGKWVQDGKLRIGSWCTVQAISFSAGSSTSAFSMLAIAVHTFVIVWCDRGLHSIKVAYAVISIPWIYVIAYLSTLGYLHRHEPDTIFRPTPYWCWFGKTYLVHRIFGGYFWLWTSLAVSVIVYIPLFFWGRGNITIGDKFWNFEIHERRAIDDPKGPRRRALSMIAYPLVFALQIIPLSVARWIGFIQESHGNRMNHVPPTAIIGVQVVWCLSGVANVALFLLTRPNLLLFRRDRIEVDDQGHRCFCQVERNSIEGRQIGLEYGYGKSEAL